MTSAFDIYATDMAGQWLELWRNLQSTRAPYSPLYGGYYTLTKYDDICEAAGDEITFSSYHDVTGARNGEQGIVIGGNASHGGFIEYDPPKYKQFRRLVAPWFAPASIDGVSEPLRSLVRTLLDRHLERGYLDFVRDLIQPVTAITTAYLVGMPVDDWYEISTAFHEITYMRHDNAEYDQAKTTHDHLKEHLRTLVESQLARPGSDLIGILSRSLADPEGAVESVEEIVQTVWLFFAGGLITTESLTSHTLRWLGAHPDTRQELIDAPAKLPRACEEFLRWSTPTQGLARTVTRECHVAGIDFKPGDRVLLAWAAGNLDPSRFDSPDAVNIDRTPNPHLAFGSGGHRCIGASLARREFVEIVGSVLEMVPDYEIDEAGVVAFPVTGIVNGNLELPATFTPRPCRGYVSDLAQYVPLRLDPGEKA